jgi:hypothetical protein
MASESGAESAQFEIGRVIGRAVSVIGSNAVTFIALATLLTLPVLIFTFFAKFAALVGIQASPYFGTQGTLLAIVSGGAIGLLLFFAFTNLLQAAITHGTIVSLNGGHASFGDCLATGLRNVVPLTGIIVVSSLGIMGGTILLVIPGIILSLMWAVVTPVRVTERTGVLETLRRSSALTSGHRGSIFVINLIIGVLSIALNLVIKPLAGLSVFAPTSGPNFPVALVVLTGLVQMVTYLIGATLASSIYYELRVVKEGIGPEQLAEVFA